MCSFELNGFSHAEPIHTTLSQCKGSSYHLILPETDQIGASALMLTGIEKSLIIFKQSRMLRTSLKKMVHFIQIGMQDGNKNVSTRYLRVFMSYNLHFCTAIWKFIFYYSMVNSWGNAPIDFATGPFNYPSKVLIYPYYSVQMKNLQCPAICTRCGPLNKVKGQRRTWIDLGYILHNEYN